MRFDRLLATLTMTSLGLACGSGADPAAQDADPPAAGAEATKGSGGRTRSSAGGFAGVGWSIAPATEDATAQALAQAEAGSAGPMDLTFLYYTPQHDPSRIIATVRG